MSFGRCNYFTSESSRFTTRTCDYYTHYIGKNYEYPALETDVNLLDCDNSI